MYINFNIKNLTTLCPMIFFFFTYGTTLSHTEVQTGLFAVTFSNYLTVSFLNQRHVAHNLSLTIWEMLPSHLDMKRSALALIQRICLNLSKYFHPYIWYACTITCVYKREKCIKLENTSNINCKAWHINNSYVINSFVIKLSIYKQFRQNMYMYLLLIINNMEARTLLKSH